MSLPFRHYNGQDEEYRVLLFPCSKCLIVMKFLAHCNIPFSGILAPPFHGCNGQDKCFIQPSFLVAATDSHDIISIICLHWSKHLRVPAHWLTQGSQALRTTTLDMWWTKLLNNINIIVTTGDVLLMNIIHQQTAAKRKCVLSYDTPTDHSVVLGYYNKWEKVGHDTHPLHDHNHKGGKN